MQIYDEAGVKHTITIYFDKVDTRDFEGGPDGEEVWEYLVTMDPAEDKRKFVNNNGDLQNVNSTNAGGILMSGTMHFNSAGAITNQTAYTWGGSQSPEKNPDSFTAMPDPAGGLEPKQVINLDPTDMKNWQPAPISSSGYPIVVPNFGGILDAQTSGTPNGAKYNTEINFGLRASNLDQPWGNVASLGDLNVDPYAYNVGHKPNDPKTGPEHILLNPTYDSTKDDKWDPDTGRYVIENRPQWRFNAAANNIFNGIQGNVASQISYKGGNNAVAIADYKLALELNGVDKVQAEVVVGANKEKVTIDLTKGTMTRENGIKLNVQQIQAVLADQPSLNAISDSIQKSINAATPKNLYLFKGATPPNANNLAKFTEPVVLEAYASTNLSGKFSSSNAQNGYGFGDLTNWNVDNDGILHGVYSNGVTLPLWQITMYDFVNTQGLRREGNNLFSETRDSGGPKMGAAGNSGLGKVAGYTLEQSNVDLATEFVYMISTQRGYQSNSKLITTVDTMLDAVINMKR